MTIEIDFFKNNALAQLTLSKPAALNALSLDMLKTLTAKLIQYRDDPNVNAIIIEGMGDRAFCAGGDVRAVLEDRDAILSGATPYFDIEYELNKLIFHYPKPYIALLDGITMGGGAGVSIWGSHPIGTERLKFAMPETRIGLFPDIGATYFLSRLPNYIGWYLGLTGNSINAYEALKLGVVKTVIHHNDIEHFKTQLNPNQIALPSTIDLDMTSNLFEHQDDIAQCFSQPSVSEIIHNLQQKDSWCQSVADTLKTCSPLSLKVTFDLLNKSKNMSFDDIISLNKKLVLRFLKDSDFPEGVRAALIDKDKKPRWKHNISEVDTIIY